MIVSYAEFAGLNTIGLVIRLLLLIPTLDRSGAEKQLMLLATRLPRSEFDVEVVALTRGGAYATELEAAGVSLTILGKRFKFDPVALHRLRRLLKQRPPDILHTWLFAANAYGRLAAGRSPRFPVVVSERCVDTWKAGWQLRVDRYLAGRTARLVANSQSVATYYREQGFPEERMTVIPNGIDLPERANASRAALRESLGIPGDARVVAYVGRLAPQKRIRDLIWAFELIRVQREDCHFLIIGDGPERERLQEFARSLRLESSLRFLGHRVDAATLLGACDLFWLASDFEGQSNSIMEAMSAGLPVVASDIPPNRELVSHGATGFLVPVGDRVALAQFAEKLLVDTELAKTLGTAGRERIGRDFSVATMVESYISLYRQLAR
jgi:glycosyltransferase involved in cell wall biosynthesis